MRCWRRCPSSALDGHEALDARCASPHGLEINTAARPDGDLAFDFYDAAEASAVCDAHVFRGCLLLLVEAHRFAAPGGWHQTRHSARAVVFGILGALHPHLARCWGRLAAVVLAEHDEIGLTSGGGRAGFSRWLILRRVWFLRRRC